MPLLTHPTEWPEATRSTLTHKLGPLPVWAWGVVIIGGVVIVRALSTHSATGSKSAAPSGGTLLPGSASGGYAFGGGGGGGGGGGRGGGDGILASSTLAPALGQGASHGGVSDVGLGAVAPVAFQPTGNVTSEGLPLFSSPSLSPTFLQAGANGPDVYANNQGLPATKLSPSGALLYLTKVGGPSTGTAYTYSTTPVGA